jgi:hypothetical protein
MPWLESSLKLDELLLQYHLSLEEEEEEEDEEEEIKHLPSYDLRQLIKLKPFPPQAQLTSSTLVAVTSTTNSNPAILGNESWRGLSKFKRLRDASARRRAMIE